MSGPEMRAIRLSLGLTQGELAVRLNRSRLYVVRHEKDVQVPEMLRLSMLALVPLERAA